MASRRVAGYTRRDPRTGKMVQVSGYTTDAAGPATADAGAAQAAGTAGVAAADPFAQPTRPQTVTTADVPDRDSERARWAAGDPPSAPAQDLLRAWYPDATIDAPERNGVVTLSRIVLPEESRNTGQGTAAMQDLVDYADATGQTVACTPSSDYGGSKTRLVKFYRRFGFVPNKGRNKDFTTKESMVRQPEG